MKRNEILHLSSLISPEGKVCVRQVIPLAEKAPNPYLQGILPGIHDEILLFRENATLQRLILLPKSLLRESLPLEKKVGGRMRGVVFPDGDLLIKVEGFIVQFSREDGKIKSSSRGDLLESTTLTPEGEIVTMNDYQLVDDNMSVTLPDRSFQRVINHPNRASYQSLCFGDEATLFAFDPCRRMIDVFTREGLSDSPSIGWGRGREDTGKDLSPEERSPRTRFPNNREKEDFVSSSETSGILQKSYPAENVGECSQPRDIACSSGSSQPAPGSSDQPSTD